MSIDAISQVRGLRELVLTSAILENFTTKIETAKKETNLDAKRVKYNEAYAILKEQPKPFGIELRKALFELLDLYAAQTCYNQASKVKNAEGKSVDPEEGMRKCARLMEMSLALQLKYLEIGYQDYDWQKYESLEELIGSLGWEQDDKGHFFSLVDTIQIDPQALLERADRHHLRGELIKTLRRLAYCYFNIKTLFVEERLPLHQKLRDWLLPLIGSTTLQDKQQLEDYLYNSNVRFVKLNNGDWKAKNACYEPIIQLLEECYAPTDPKRIGRESQIHNMKALNTINGIGKEGFAEAEPLFEKAFAARKELLDRSTPEDRSLQGYFLSNIRTSLIHVLVNKEPFSWTNQIKAWEHAEALKAYLKENEADADYQSYQDSYTKAIVKARSHFAEIAQMTLVEVETVYNDILKE